MSEIRVTNIIGETGVDAVNFTKGINAPGIVTATSFAGSGAALTGVVAGKINQVVSMVYEPGCDVTPASTSFQDSGMTLQITPSNTNSKILLFGTCNGHKISNADSNSIINIKRAVSGGSTGNLSGQNLGLAHTYETNATTSPFFFIDGTTGTAQRTYTVIFRTDNGSRTASLVRAATSNTFMAMEILP